MRLRWTAAAAGPRLPACDAGAFLRFLLLRVHGIVSGKGEDEVGTDGDVGHW